MARKILIINGHPDRHGAHLITALADNYSRGALSAGHEVRLLRLAEMKIGFIGSAEEFTREPDDEEIRSAQADILWCDHLVVAFPLWLGSEPALAKAFFEQTLRYGFALPRVAKGFPKGLLRGRSARLIVTMGMPALLYRWYFGAYGVRSMERSMLGIAGFGPVRRTLIGGIGPDMSKRAVAVFDAMQQLGRDAR